MHRAFGGHEAGVAAGLALRHDHGSQYLSDVFQDELNFVGIARSPGLTVRHDHGSQYQSDFFPDVLRFLGVTSSQAFVRAPEGNGCAERFIRTLKEQLRWVRTFATVEELRLAPVEFQARSNQHWLIERHGHQTPAAMRAALALRAAVAA